MDLSALLLVGSFLLTAEVVVAICDINSWTFLEQEIENERAVYLSLPRKKGDNKVQNLPVREKQKPNS